MDFIGVATHRRLREIGIRAGIVETDAIRIADSTAELLGKRQDAVKNKIRNVAVGHGLIRNAKRAR